MSAEIVGGSSKSREVGITADYENEISVKAAGSDREALVSTVVRKIVVGANQGRGGCGQGEQLGVRKPGVKSFSAFAVTKFCPCEENARVPQKPADESGAELSTAGNAIM